MNCRFLDVCCPFVKLGDVWKKRIEGLPSPKLTVCTWKWMVGRLLSFWGPAYFQGRLLFVSGSVKNTWKPSHQKIEPWSPCLGLLLYTQTKNSINILKMLVWKRWFFEHIWQFFIIVFSGMVWKNPRLRFFSSWKNRSSKIQDFSGQI